MKKKWLWLIIGLLCHTVVSAGGMGKFDVDAKNWNVTADEFGCTFFQGCMYPVWFTGSKGEEFPFFVFSDRISDGKKIFKIYEERWAEFAVLENTDSRFVIECKGNFCDGLPPHNTPCKTVAASYRYTIEKNSPDVKIQIRMTRQDTVPYQVEVVRLRWRFMPFQTYRSANSTIDLPSAFQTPRSLETSGGVLLSPSMNLAVSGKRMKLSWDHRENGFFYLQDADAICNWPAKEAEFHYESVLRFSPGTGVAK